jgi:hypothetical protein
MTEYAKKQAGLNANLREMQAADKSALADVEDDNGDDAGLKLKFKLKAGDSMKVPPITLTIGKRAQLQHSNLFRSLNGR